MPKKVCTAWLVIAKTNKSNQPTNQIYRNERTEEWTAQQSQPGVSVTPKIYWLCPSAWMGLQRTGFNATGKAHTRRIQTFCCHFDQGQKKGKLLKNWFVGIMHINSNRIKSRERMTKRKLPRWGRCGGWVPGPAGRKPRARGASRGWWRGSTLRWMAHLGDTWSR